MQEFNWISLKFWPNLLINAQFGQNFFYFLSNKLALLAAIVKNNPEEWLLSEIENKFFSVADFRYVLPP